MTPPILVTPPASPLVELATLKTHLRVDGTDDDNLLLDMEKASVARLDGWHGELGRCLNAQTWRQEFCAWGQLRFPFPDVTNVSVVGYDADGTSICFYSSKVFLSGFYLTL